MIDEQKLEEQAILNILNKLYYEAKSAFNHDCARCGEIYFKNSNSNNCHEKDRQLLEERIPKWEKRLEECRSKNGINN